MKTLILLISFLAVSSNIAYADQSDLTKETARMAAKGLQLTAGEVKDLQDKGWRSRRGGENWPLVTKFSRPSDYMDEADRGTVEYSLKARNYSYHKIKIPSGTIIDGANFSQAAPGTDAIDRTPGIYGHNLTFRDCNLVNLVTYPDWTLERSNTAQLEILGTVDEEHGVMTTGDSVYVSGSYEKLPKNRVRPNGVLK